MPATPSRSRRFGSLGTMVLGVLIGGTFVAPASAQAPSTSPRVTQTRAVSCHAIAFQPLDSTMSYAYTQTRLHWFSGNSGYFICDPHLPHRATVTQVRFTVYDVSTTGELVNCGLVRAPLASGTAHLVTVMAQVPPTGVGSTPARERLVDTTITAATIDNLKYAYWLQCEFKGGAGSTLGLYGADVTFTIDSANG